MADEKDSRSQEDLTEEASPYRIEEFRRKGQVSQSREISGMVALLGVGVVVYAYAPKMGIELSEFMKDVFRTDLSSRINLGDHQIIASLMNKALHLAILMGLPACIAGFLVALLKSEAFFLLIQSNLI
jgi:flagellar biosynthesis protein FlhB